MPAESDRFLDQSMPVVVVVEQVALVQALQPLTQFLKVEMVALATNL
jgi:hypothetical protein